MPDFLERLGDELVRVAGTPVAPAPHTQLPEPRPALRRRPRWLPALIGLLIAGAAAAAIATLGRRSPGPVPPRAGAPLATAPDTADSAAFAVLRRGQRPGDTVPVALPVALSGASGANLDLSRGVSRGAHERAWVIPGRGSVCLIAVWQAPGAGGAACGPDRYAVAGRLALVAGALGRPGRTFLAGLVPDGVSSVTVRTSSGRTTILGVRENVYQAEVAGRIASVALSGSRAGVRIAGLSLPRGLGAPRR